MDMLKSRIIIAYALFLLMVSLVLFSLDDNPGKSLLSILNIAIIVVPLVCMIFSTIHYYNSYEFLELLLAQPMSRSAILWCEFAALCAALTLAILTGLGIPSLLYFKGSESLWMIASISLLSLSCAAIALLISVRTRDKARGIEDQQIRMKKKSKCCTNLLAHTSGEFTQSLIFEITDVE